MLMNRTILILAAHPDDDVLSFGGLITKSINSGDKVIVRIFACGGKCSNVSDKIRYEEFEKVMEFLKVEDYGVIDGGWNSDGRLDQIPNCDLTGLIDQLIQAYKPTHVYCSALSEHADHQALAKAFTASARLKSGWMPRMFAFGTYPFSDQLYTSSNGGKMFLPLTKDEFNNKLEAFKLYKSQFKPSPSPLGERGLRVMSEYYGMLCGAEYAELYYQLRYICD